MILVKAAILITSSFNFCVRPLIRVKGWILLEIISLIILARAISSLDNPKSPVGVVLFIMLAKVMSSRLKPAAILFIIAVSTLIASNSLFMIMPLLIMISKV